MARTSWDGEAAAGGNVPGTEAVKGKANVDGAGEAEEYMVRRLGWRTDSRCIALSY